MDSIRFRRAVATDAAQIRDLTTAAYAPWIAVLGRKPLPMETDYDLAVQTDLIEILDLGGQMAALIQMQMAQDHLWIENVAVHPDHQGRGLGHHLIARAEAMAADLDLRELRLLTNALLTRNLRFYAALGFVETHRTAFRGGFVVHFSKALPN